MLINYFILFSTFIASLFVTCKWPSHLLFYLDLQTVDQFFGLSLPLDITHLQALLSIIFHTLDSYLHKVCSHIGMCTSMGYPLYTSFYLIIGLVESSLTNFLAVYMQMRFLLFLFCIHTILYWLLFIFKLIVYGTEYFWYLLLFLSSMLYCLWHKIFSLFFIYFKFCVI